MSLQHPMHPSFKESRQPNLPSQKLNSYRRLAGNDLRDGDLAALVLRGFGYQDGKDTVLHACLDGVLVHSSRKAEGASELSYAALRYPVLGLFLGLLGLLFLGRDGGAGLVGGIFVLNRGFVAVLLLAALSDGAG